MKNILILFVLVNLAFADFLRDDTKEIVMDTSTNLMWQDNNDTNGTTKTWSEANVYCQNLDFGGFTNWKLPNSNELLSISDMTKNNPAINSTFIYIKSERYWSSSSYKNDSVKAWCVNFNYSYLYMKYKTDEYYVRCVRVVE